MPTFGESPPAWTMPVTWMRGDNLGDKFIEGQKFGIESALARQRLELAQQAQASEAISQGLRNQLMQEQLANITGAKVEWTEKLKQYGNDPAKWMNAVPTSQNPIVRKMEEDTISAAQKSELANTLERDKGLFAAQTTTLSPARRSYALSKMKVVNGAIAPESYIALEQAMKDQAAEEMEQQIVAKTTIRQLESTGKQVDVTYDNKGAIKAYRVRPPTGTTTTSDEKLVNAIQNARQKAETATDPKQQKFWSDQAEMLHQQLRNNASQISPTTAFNAVVNPMDWAMAQSMFGSDATNLVNIAKSGFVPATSSAQTAPPPVASAKPTVPKAGDVYKGYRFKGGDPAKKENWEKVQ